MVVHLNASPTLSSYTQISSAHRPSPYFHAVADDHRRLGWVLVDIRTMKQNALEYAPGGESEGVWLELVGSTFRADKGNAAPSIRVFASLKESPPDAFAKLVDPARNSVAFSVAPEIGGASPRCSLNVTTSASASVPAPVTKTEEESIAPSNVDAPSEIMHLFTLTADVRSFKSTRRLPFPTASVVVKLMLPEDLLNAIDFGGRPKAAAATPVRTNPPASVARASEVVLQNGLGAVDFGTGVMSLATALASGPRVVCEVWHKDAYTEDVLLGTATVSLAPLLREPTLDGYAPVMSDSDPETPGAPRSALLLESEAVKVGELRVVLSLAEKGPLPSWAAASSVATSAAHGEEFTHADAVAVDLSHSGTGERSLSQSLASQSRVPSAVVKASTLRASMERTAAGVTVVTAERAQTNGQRAGGEEQPYEQRARESMAAGVADSIVSMDGLRKGREYAVAWELEVWKQAQEAKWTASMRAREAERMAALEGEWRRREAQREAEHRRVTGECAAVEKKLSGALAATQERERRLIAAEESLSVRREAERREMAQRMSEAQHAVRRLQQECEHQLEMEKGRTADVERRAATLEERVEEANARAAAVEHAFHGYKRAHLESSEATLHAEIATLQQRKSDAETTARDAVKSRDRFKTQIQKMAKQVVALERERTYLRAALANLSTGGNENYGVEANRSTLLSTQNLAPPKPAPSAADFADELFGGGGFDSRRNGSGAGAGGASFPQPDDPFLREFRESVAELEAEARGSEYTRYPAAPPPPGTVPFVPAGVAIRSPSKSPRGSPSKSPIRSPVKQRPGTDTRSKLDQLRSRRVAKAFPVDDDMRHASKPSEERQSVDSESGLKALFASAEEFEAEQEKNERNKTEEKTENVTDASNIPETKAKGSESKASPIKELKPIPITAASLAEKRSLEKQVRRLVAERAELMATGAYSSSDRVISLIDEKIAEITNAVAKG